MHPYSIDDAAAQTSLRVTGSWGMSRKKFLIGSSAMATLANTKRQGNTKIFISQIPGNEKELFKEQIAHKIAESIAARKRGRNKLV